MAYGFRGARFFSEKKTQSGRADMMRLSRPSPTEQAMDDAAFWREQALKFRHRADTTTDAPLRLELVELAEICEEVAAEIEDRATAG